MFDLLIQATLSNLLVSTMLAALAWVVQLRVRSGSLVSLLWAIVLIKMVTPPVFLIPAVALPNFSNHGRDPVRDAGREVPGVSTPLDAASSTASAAGLGNVAVAAMRSQWMSGALCAWMGVSALLFCVSTARILKFHRLLKLNSRLAPSHILEVASEVAERIGLRGVPRVVLSGAHVAPFVWWLGGRPRITISEQAASALSRHDLRLVIAHEMAHIKRRDHLVRWLEWLTANVFWWNPVMWWARSQLRLAEEIACDNLVIETIGSERRRYASALLNMADLLISPVIRSPAVVSAMNSGGDLERRLKMIIGKRTWQAPTALRLAIAGAAIGILPLGLVYSQDTDAVEGRLAKAVDAGELTPEQAKVMMDALRQTADPGGEKTDRAREVSERKIEYAKIEQKIKAAVDDGKMSPGDAKKQLAAVRTKLLGAAKDGTEKDRDSKLLAEFAAIERKIKTAVDEGKLSPIEGKKELAAIHEKLFDAKKDQTEGDRDPAALKMKYAAIERKIKAAVEDGKLSPDKAKRKLAAIRAEMFSPNEVRDQGSSRDP